MKTYFEGLVELAILNNKENRKLCINDPATYGYLRYYLNFCTVKLDIGRASGKTTFIKSHANKDDMIIVSNRFLKTLLYQDFDNVFAVEEIESIPAVSFYGKQPYKNVYIDDASFVLDQIDIVKLYEHLYLIFRLTGDVEHTFVLLG